MTRMADARSALAACCYLRSAGTGGYICHVAVAIVHVKLSSLFELYSLDHI